VSFFRGDRRVWLLGAAMLIASLGLTAYYLLRDGEHYTGTNSVGVRGIVAEVGAGKRLCIPDLDIPKGSARAQLSLTWPGPRRPAIRVERRSPGTAFVGTEPGGAEAGQPGPIGVNLNIGRVRTRADSVRTTICVTPRGAALIVGGTAGVQADQRSPTIDGKELGSRVAIRYLGPAGDTSSTLALLPDAFRRAAVFRPGIVAAWWYPVIFLLVLPALWLVSLRVLAVASAGGHGSARRTGALIAGVAIVNAVAWSLITPAWNGPDEPDHFAYAQSLAERGQVPDKQAGDSPAFSAELTAALDASRTYSVVALGDTKPPWLPIDERRYQARADPGAGAEDNGGGYLVSTSSHLPGYYALVSAGYLLGDSGSTFTELALMRLISALLAGVAAACAFATVLELLPGRRGFAAAAGLLVAFQPMVAFMFGVVNNDAGVNAVAALLVYLLVRGLRRGPSVGWGIALGLTLVALPAMKATGAALYPAAAVALLGMLWRRHGRADLPGYGAFAGTLAAAFVVRRLLVSLVEPPVVPSGGGAATASGPINYVLDQPQLYLSYAWQMFLPRLWFMNDLHIEKWPAFYVFIETGWGAFGWLVFRFPAWVYVVIVSVSLLMALCCLVALVKGRAAALHMGWEIAVLALVIAGVVFGVEAAYLTDTPRLIPAEQGRYVFTALVPLAVVAVGGALAFRSRLQPLVLTALVAATMALGYAGQLLALSGFFT
jgi:Predicted membrane protein (DUF2142)